MDVGMSLVPLDGFLNFNFIQELSIFYVSIFFHFILVIAVGSLYICTEIEAVDG